ncbi:MAG TPA: FimV/HubP family polar landmark protein, partial [Myxococcota bacterium]|nr:FimV/HubP family polar landmark protein [Myxococcota bacterium]
SIRESGGEAAEADWPKIAIMGRQICPGEPLFESAEAAPVDVDFGEDVPEVPAAGDDLSASGSWLDFDIGEAEEPGEPVGEGVEDTREQPAPDLSESKIGEGTAELSLDELGIDLELGESGEYALQDLAERAPEMDEEPAGEVEPEKGTGEDAGEDEGEEEGTLMMSAPRFGTSSDAPTQRGEGFDLGEDEPTLSGVGGLEEVPADEDTLLEPRKDSAGGDEPTVMGLESDLEEEGDETQLKRFEMPSEEAPTTEVDVSIEEEDADLDLDDLTQVLEAEMGEDSDEATQVATGLGTESRVPDEEESYEEIDDTREMPAADESAADESAPAEMDEVGTKLDLARAYIDMGDPDGARSILEEVADEGDEAQREEARQLL